MSLRLAVAKQEGLTEAMADQLDHYRSSNLSPQQIAALQLADSLMTQPGQITTELRDELRRHFTTVQIIELTLDVMKWNYQKVSVALGTDAEVVPGELVDLVFDDSGHWVRA